MDDAEDLLGDCGNNEEYEPTEQEVEGYAEFLGINLAEDRDLLYIAKEGIKARIPEP